MFKWIKNLYNCFLESKYRWACKSINALGFTEDQRESHIQKLVSKRPDYVRRLEQKLEGQKVFSFYESEKTEIHTRPLKYSIDAAVSRKVYEQKRQPTLDPTYS
jgi:hypothetical protein